MNKNLIVPESFQLTVEQLERICENLASSDTESAHQTALFCWLRSPLTLERYPVQFAHAIPNGGARSAITGARLKAEGVKPGVPDLFIPTPSASLHGLYIEMKKPSVRPKRGGKGGLSDDQLEFRDWALGYGYGWAVCYSWKEARKVIRQYFGDQVD